MVGVEHEESNCSRVEPTNMLFFPSAPQSIFVFKSVFVSLFNFVFVRLESDMRAAFEPTNILFLAKCILHSILAPLVSVIEIFNLTGPKIYKGKLIWTPWNFQIAVSRRRNKIF